MWRVTLFIDTTRRIFWGLVRKKIINKTFPSTVSTNLSNSSSSRERRVEEEFLNSYQLYSIVSEYCHNWKSISNLQIKVIYNWCLVNAQRKVTHTYIEVTTLKPAIQTTAHSLVTAAEKALQMGRPPLKGNLCPQSLAPGPLINPPHTPVFILDHIGKFFLVK